MTISAVSSFKENKEPGRLYLVPTPIGNLSDMTPRAVETLKNVDLIAAEDTRHTQMLLNHFEISTPQISFHEHNTRERIPLLVKKLEEGQTIAQVSDAGMPSISDLGTPAVLLLWFSSQEKQRTEGRIAAAQPAEVQCNCL